MPESLQGVAETYDSAFIAGFSEIKYNDDTLNSVIAKYGKNGALLWKTQLKHSWIQQLVVTPDSGFLVAANVYVHHEIPYVAGEGDSLYKATLIKFDKCGKLLWSKYIEAENPLEGRGQIGFPISFMFRNLQVNASNGDIYVSGSVAGLNDGVRKLTLIMKYAKDGLLLNYKFFDGIQSVIYYSSEEKNIYFSQDIYIPKKGDTAEWTTSYLFTGTKKLDTSLNLQAQNVIGFQKDEYNQWGSLFIKGDKVVQTAARRNSNNIDYPMFAVYDKDLKITSSDYIYDKDGKNRVWPLALSGGILYGDSMIISNKFFSTDRSASDFCTSLRLYNEKYQLRKKVDIIKDWSDEPMGVWKLKSGNFLAGITYRNSHYSALYLYDRHLNEVNWPTTSPEKGYDWACTNTIPSSREIDVPKVVERIYIKLDTTRVNWNWVWNDQVSIKEPLTGNVENGWLVYPQPAPNGNNIYFKLLNSLKPSISSNLNATFYDLHGREISSTSAVANGNNQWFIADVNLPRGMYFVTLKNWHTGIQITTIKVLVR